MYAKQLRNISNLLGRAGLEVVNSAKVDVTKYMLNLHNVQVSNVALKCDEICHLLVCSLQRLY